LSKIEREKTVLFLDAHYCGPGTANSGNVLLRELSAIKETGIMDLIIIIDDIRGLLPCAGPNPGPDLAQVKNAVLAINNSYCFKVLGEQAIAYLPEESFITSSAVDACTISRLYGYDTTITEDQVLKAEKLIGQSSGLDRDAIFELSVFREGGYYQFWKGLILLEEKDCEEAKQLFKDAMKDGFLNRLSSLV